ncbi:MAG: pyridoxine 5'-phosphate synthase [Opitutales bacterium]
MTERPILLGVNVDHCATLRQARYRADATDCGGIVEPDPVSFAQEAERAGADGITVHLREDRRHIQESDVRRLRACLATRLNLEMAATDEMTAFALEIRPATVCIVPENRTEVTTEGGLDVAGQSARIAQVIQALKPAGIGISLFINADPAQIQTAATLRADYVELHTGEFANAFHDPAQREAQLQRLKQGAVQAHELGLIVNAGHGISYVNAPLVRDIPWLHELNIGHSILSRCVFTGIGEAVREMKARINGVLR